MAAPAQPTIIIPPTVLNSDESLDELELDEIGLLSEQLAVHSIESESRHEEILGREEEIQQCLTRIETAISSPNETTQPVTQALLTEVTALKSEVSELRGMLIAIQAALTALSVQPRPSQQTESSETMETELQTEAPAEQSVEQSTDERAPVETSRRPKHRVI